MSLGDRVRRGRQARKINGKPMTQVQLVAAVKKLGGELSQSELSAIENDQIERPGALPEIAAVLGLTSAELLGKPVALRPSREEAQTPIRHYVGAGDEVHLFEGESDSEAIDYTPAPPGFEREKGAAVTVRGDSMRPYYEPGDMLFFRFRYDFPASPKDLPLRPVIVQVKNGPLYVKKLLPGTRKGRFHLLSVNPLTAALQDQLVESFAYIEWVKPKAL